MTMKFDEYEKFVLLWNNKFPLDRWYREKHGIPFMSEEHRRVSFLTMRLEWAEEQLLKKAEREEEYTPNKNDYLKERYIRSKAERATDYLAELMKRENGKTKPNSTN